MIKRQIFLDTETTGLSARQGHRIIELAAIEMEDGELTGRAFHSYFDPERVIDPRAELVHGMSYKMLKGKPKFADSAINLIEFLAGSECLMHNASFDMNFIDAELELSGHKTKLNEIALVTCTMKLARKKFPGENATLDALITKAGLSVIRDKHSALEDAELLADVYKILFKKIDCQEKYKKDKAVKVSNNALPNSTTIVTPVKLRMEKTIELSNSRKETFFYRGKHKRIIGHQVINNHRWKKINGPLLYAVTDQAGAIQYLGKWVSETALYSRWIRHDTIHHQESTRNIYLAELDAGRGPLTVWSVSVKEIRHLLPDSTKILSEKEIAKSLEALWIKYWRSDLKWNIRNEPITIGFNDGKFWL